MLECADLPRHTPTGSAITWLLVASSKNLQGLKVTDLFSDPVRVARLYVANQRE